MSCGCDDIGFGCRRRKSTFLWLWFGSIFLVSCKSTVIVSPVLVSLDLSSYPLYLPSLPSVGAPSAVNSVRLSKKEKDVGLRRCQFHHLDFTG